MPFLVMFVLFPLAISAGIEFLVCWMPFKKRWRALPPVLAAVVTTIIIIARYTGWDRSGAAGAPLETLLFFPGLPALFVFIGLLAGWLIGRNRQPKRTRVYIVGQSPWERFLRWFTGKK